jgi:hypothetical protein
MLTSCLVNLYGRRTVLEIQHMGKRPGETRRRETAILISILKETSRDTYRALSN